MGFTTFVIEIYINGELTERKRMTLPIVFAIEEAKNICMELSQYQQPMRVVFTNENGDKLEYKNKGECYG